MPVLGAELSEGLSPALPWPQLSQQFPDGACSRAEIPGLPTPRFPSLSVPRISILGDFHVHPSPVNPITPVLLSSAEILHLHPSKPPTPEALLCQAVLKYPFIPYFPHRFLSCSDPCPSGPAPVLFPFLSQLFSSPTPWDPPANVLQRAGTGGIPAQP